MEITYFTTYCLSVFNSINNLFNGEHYKIPCAGYRSQVDAGTIEIFVTLW